MQAHRAARAAPALTLVARAMMELTEHLQELSPSQVAHLFCQLMDAVSDKDEGDHEHEMTTRRWRNIGRQFARRLNDEYSRTQGSFASSCMGGRAWPHAA